MTCTVMRILACVLGITGSSLLLPLAVAVAEGAEIVHPIQLPNQIKKRKKSNERK